MGGVSKHLFSIRSLREKPFVVSKCQMSKRRKIRYIVGGFHCSICLLESARAYPNDWRKCWSKLIFCIIVKCNSIFDGNFLSRGCQGDGGLKQKCPPWGRGGGGGLDIFWNYTMRYWTQYLRAPLLRLSPAPTRFSRKFSRPAFLAILKPRIGYKGNKIYTFTCLYRSPTE